MKITTEFPNKPGLYWGYRYSRWVGVYIEENQFTDGRPYYQCWVVTENESVPSEYFEKWYGPLEEPEPV